MRIALDAMGTDDAPAIEVAGAIRAIRELEGDYDIVLIGDEDLIGAELARHEDFSSARLSIHHASERIDPRESPASAVRRKRDSSIVVAMKLQQEGAVDAFVSAGSTGAVMAASLFILRPLPGVHRPAIGTVRPTAKGPALMLDAGANVDCKPSQLVQFAFLGKIYAQDLMGLPNPRIALLNIGEEPEKGDEVSVETHRLLLASGLNFIGNVEGRDIIRGECDVLVCDGFVGNIILKFAEGFARTTLAIIGKEMKKSLPEVGGVLSRRLFNQVKKDLDYAEYGGVPLLGVNGVCVVAHAASSSKAVKNAIYASFEFANGNINRDIEKVLGTKEGKSNADEENEDSGNRILSS